MLRPSNSCDCSMRQLATDLARWLAILDNWPTSRGRRITQYRIGLAQVSGVVEIMHNPKTNSLTASLSVHSDAFDIFLYGKASDSSIILIQSGFLVSPFQSNYAYPDDRQSIDQFRSRIEKEAPIFFSALDCLPKIYCELTERNPRFKRADPRSRRIRLMHAAVVAFLLKLDWEKHLAAAYRVEFHLDNDWLDAVSARLEDADAARSE